MSGLIRLIAGPPKAQAIAGFKLQTSIAGLPIPIVYGTARVAGNIIDMPSQPTKSGSLGGKRAAKAGVSNENYVGPVALALCEGPIVGIGQVWRDKDLPVQFSVKNFGFTLFLGTTTQGIWEASHPVHYPSTAYVANHSADFPGGSLQSFSWEILGFLPFAGGPDASPADIIPDYLTNAQYGAGFPSARLGDLTQFVNYCAAAGLLCSPVFDSQSPATDQLNELLEVANTGAVWSDGVLKFVPYGDTALTANGHTFTPNVTPIYDLTDDDCLPRGGDLDPILVTRTDPAAAYNQVTVEYEDRDTVSYNATPYTASDDVAIAIAGSVRPLPRLALHSIKTAAVAQTVAQTRLQREQNIRNTYQFNLGWRFSLLEPMDLVTLTDPGLGLSRTIVRITKIEEQADEQGFAVTAEEWPLGTGHAALYTTPSNTATAIDGNVDPGNTATPVIFEGPLAPTELWIAASGGPNWGGCDVYGSTDNVEYYYLGRILGKAAYGVLTAALASGSPLPAIDTVNTLAVDLTASGGAVASGAASDVPALLTLCWVDGEYLSYETAALTGAFTYNLTTLGRGAFGSAIPSSHAIGAPFVRCDPTQGLLKVEFPQAAIGETLYFKLPAFNLLGNALQDLSTVSSVSHVVAAPGVNPLTAPAASITEVSETATTVTLTLDGTGFGGAVSYRVRQSNGATMPAWGSFVTSPALPQALVVTRLPIRAVNVELEVEQADGQTALASFAVSPQLPSLEPTAGHPVRGYTFDDGGYALRATDSGGLDTHPSVNIGGRLAPDVGDATGRALSGLDTSGVLQTGMAPGATIVGLPSAIVGKQLGAVLVETWEVLPSAATGWSVSGVVPTLLANGQAVMGANLLRCGGFASLAGPRIPFNQNALYRMRVRVETGVYNSGGAGVSTYYAGVLQTDYTGAATNANSGAGYICAEGENPGLFNFTEYVGWFKGASQASGVTTLGISTDPTAPTPLNSGTVAIQPYLLMGYNGSGGDFFCDYFLIDEFDVDGTVRTYSVIGPTGGVYIPDTEDAFIGTQATPGTKSKTQSWSSSVFGVDDSTKANQFSIANGLRSQPGTIGLPAFIFAIPVPIGAELTAVSFPVHVGASESHFQNFSIVKISSTGTATTLGTYSSPLPTGWGTVTIPSLSEVIASGFKYFAVVSLDNGGSGIPNNVGFQGIDVTYDVSTYSQSL